MTITESRQKRKKLTLLADHLWIVGAIIFAAALLGHGLIGFRYVERISEGELLAFESSEATRYLSKLDNPQRRQTRTNESEIQLKKLEAEFPNKLSGPSTVTKLIQLAERVNMRVTDISTQPGSGNEVGTHIYDTLSIEAHLEGNLDSLREFLAELEDDYIEASRLDRLDIKNITPLPGSSAGSGSSSTVQEDDSIGVTLLMSVFARVETVEENRAELASNPSERSHR